MAAAGSARRGRQGRDDRGKSDVFLSKGMSRILRHKAKKMGLNIGSDGFLSVDELLQKSWLSSKGYNMEDVERVVQSDDKQRFTIREDADTGGLEIRANQGHSMEVPDLDVKPLADPSIFPDVIHGTYTHNWQMIKTQGLKRMGRNHIHFAPGEPGEDAVISGMRKSCDIIIFIDLQKALNDGIEFCISANNVILSKGEGDSGCILPKYFKKVLQRRPVRCELPLEAET